MNVEQFKSLGAAFKSNRTLKDFKLNNVCLKQEEAGDVLWEDQEGKDNKNDMSLVCTAMGEAVGSSCLESFSFCVIFSAFHPHYQRRS